MEVRIVSSAPVAASPSISASPTAGPSAIATAAARLSSTTGEGSSAPGRWYRAAICGQSVSRRGRLVVEGRDRRLELVRPGPAGRSARSTSARPSSIARVPARAVLVVEQHEVAAVADPRVAPGVVEQHQREQPGRLGLVGEQRQQTRASRIASAHSSRRISASPDVAA